MLPRILLFLAFLGFAEDGDASAAVNQGGAANGVA
jgi:hypothetical protein